MYKTAVRAMVRHSIRKLNEGDPGVLLRMASPSAELCFPGHNSWASQFRPVVKGRQQHVTHRGLDECRAFAQRFVDDEIQFVIEDMLVNGPPWNIRIALRVHDYSLDAEGRDRYNNRAVAFLVIRWGRLISWEDYEDTERTASWDRERASLIAPLSEAR